MKENLPSFNLAKIFFLEILGKGTEDAGPLKTTQNLKLKEYQFFIFKIKISVCFKQEIMEVKTIKVT